MVSASVATAIADGDTAGARCSLKCPELRTRRYAPKPSASLFAPYSPSSAGRAISKPSGTSARPLIKSSSALVGLTRRNKKTRLLTMPGYGAINDNVNRIEPVEFARALNTWLTGNSELLPKFLALDGKSIGAKGSLGGIVTLCYHSTGQPLAQRTYSGKRTTTNWP
ncbi:MAG: hypothetical protein OSA84_03475 [Akkermansiaceae bacterium]|nr:hypothetical protein [Akkermansiaceae bacterium]